MDTGADGAVPPVLRLAMVKEDLARQILAQMRARDDPLIVSKDRGDRTVRGVSILIGEKLHELFGKPLDGIAAILAEVAFDQKVSRQVVRSARRKKPAQIK
jgi:hypothetical protein